ncbi:BEN domain-containing protein 3 isoform X1 [Tachysurus vachellii]|uniref:BEN domain-containing protein 3 isoform X1 n=1 Tax=Tachysurus vachellii TaxID=175792 RepID=UPI00296B3FD7|nr:BEN domain-containing protein 3 isoform X1 [Tachysurus vachellii]
MTQHRQKRHVTRGHGTPRHGEAEITRGANAWTRKRSREESHGAVEPRDAQIGAMSSPECGIKLDGLDKEVKVEKNPDDISNVDTKQNLEDKSVDCFTQRIAKRCASRGLDAISSEQSQSTGRKKAKVSLQAGELVQDSGSEETSRSPQDRSISSYRKPLYGISHRISEKKAASSMDPHEAGVRVSRNGILFPKLDSLGHLRSDVASSSRSSTSPGASDSHLYSLFEKMFFILNSLNSSMTQLHSKVDLLSLEVTRIKKQIKPSEMAMEFQPPPEYQLTREELGQLMEQTSAAGELGCRLLVQLFPELFTAKECAHGCRACGIVSRPVLDSLHIQLVRNYVESCYPLVKNGNAWQNECLPQLNDFFNHFWAQKDMESGQVCGKQTGFDVDQNHGCLFINEDGQDERLSLDSGENPTINDSHFSHVKSDLVFDCQESGENPDDITSAEEFVVFLLNRLFPEVFEEGRIPEGHRTVGELIVNSDRLEIIRKYMEANFPEMPEDTWLQLCVQRMEEALENVSSNGGDQENLSEEIYNPISLPDDVSVVKISDFSDYDKCNRRSKRLLLEPVDFNKMDVPHPDFDVPQEYLLTKEQLRSIYNSSLSIGNFASRLLVLMFPELFTQDNTRKHYNCSGSLGKKQLDPVRINLIRHYVQLLYPRAKNDRVWTLEFVGKLDERCRRRDTEQRRSYQQQRKIYTSDQDLDLGDFVCASQIPSDRPKDDSEVPSLPPEKSSKDFCKIPLEDLKVSAPDFPVPSSYLLTDSEVREIVQQSLSVGNFAARLLVRLFPELFTHENLRLQYNHSGACNKKQLDPVRLRLIRHYVEAVYPAEKMEEVWHYECVPSIDERCRRPNRKKCDILKKAKRSNSSLTCS